jgi:hypothetical protein
MWLLERKARILCVASKASGYTPSAGSGALPHTPVKQKKEKEHEMQKIKDKKFAFRVSESDLNKIRIKAKRAKMTVTDYLVTSALGHQITVIDGIDELTKELKPIGRNINQITTLAHMGRYPKDLLEKCVEQFSEIYSALNRLLGEVR